MKVTIRHKKILRQLVPLILFEIQLGMMQKLAEELDIRLAKLGFPPEKRPFKPHLTLARIKYLKNKKAFYQAVEKYRNTFMQTAEINELVFYRSILKPHGPEYKFISKIDLNSF